MSDLAPTDTYTGNPHSPGCLLCEIDKAVTDAGERAAAYLYIADMAVRVGRLSWQEYTDCCRAHAMLSVRTSVRLNDLFFDLTVGKEPNVLPKEVVDKMRAEMRRTLAALEEAVIARYDQRTT